MPSFHVDGRVSVKLDYDLAIRLGEFLINSKTKDKQFIALGHRLVSLDQSEENPERNLNFENNDWLSYSSINNMKNNFKEEAPNYLESEIVKSVSPPIRLKKRIIK